ncbi:hypothetical protein BTE77_31395 [Ensifer adhaerens]|nr:hypothetical protein BTE77_31395 [Ensifer adhaerens]
MSDKAKFLTRVTIPLTVPLAIKDAAGRDAERTSLTMQRPKTRHVKRLAVAIGPQVLNGLMAGKGDKVDTQDMAQSLFQALLTGEKLDALTAIIADLCGEAPEQIDDLDPADLWSVGLAFADFFPALRSFVSTSLRATAPPSTDGAPAT